METHRAVNSDCTMVASTSGNSLTIADNVRFRRTLFTAAHNDVVTNSYSASNQENSNADFSELNNELETTESASNKSPHEESTALSNSNSVSNEPDTSATSTSTPTSTPTPATQSPTAAPSNQTSPSDSSPPPASRNPTYQELGIITEKPKRYELAVRCRRLATFDPWPTDHHIKKEDLADAGFYYANYADCARCYYCGGGVTQLGTGR
ncbi:hypothetical protein RRG08_064351 [Elysia crispata]|uniref:Uncharacterized protein n=1 Tax=Elysia crispata TaxID=231223 RepID=A0AAE1CX12_9GAST|nr:hypothetical protein RRG08_064351 [Elysia crispata]